MHAEKFIYEPNIVLDLEYLTTLCLSDKQKNPEIRHQRLIDDPYLLSIRKELPFLSPIFNIYRTAEMGEIPLHIDSKRKAAFNIPILNTENSSTIFYEPVKNLELQYVPERVYDLIKSEVKESFRFTLLKPTLINNSIPHMVINKSMTTRVIISWSISMEYDFYDAMNFFKEYEKNKKKILL